MGAFCTNAKNSGEMSKKGLKTGRNGVKFFWGPHTCSIITFVAFFIFNIFRFGALQIFKFMEISPENRVL